MSSSSSTSSDNNPTTGSNAANALAYSSFADPLLLSAVGNQTNLINSFPACYVPMFLPDSKFPRQLTRRTVKLWQRLILAYAVMEIYDLGKLSASVRIELCPECFNKHAKMVMEFYKDYIPQKVSYSDFISADAKGTPVRGNNIWEIWQEASHTVLSRYMPIWRRVVPVELQEGTHPAKRYEPYLLELRKELFEINDEVAQAQVSKQNEICITIISIVIYIPLFSRATESAKEVRTSKMTGTHWNGFHSCFLVHYHQSHLQNGLIILPSISTKQQIF
jgi:hypothetical protein